MLDLTLLSLNPVDVVFFFNCSMIFLLPLANLPRL